MGSDSLFESTSGQIGGTTDMVVDSSSQVGNVPGTLLGGLLAPSLMTTLIGLALLVLMIVGTWKMFEKAGEAGWKSLIPVYNTYLLYKMAWSSRAFLYDVVCCLVLVSSAIGVAHASIAAMFGDGSSAMLGVWSALAMAASVAELVLTVIRGVKLAHAFGRETVWAVGIVLIPSVFYVIMGFMPEVSYVGPDDGSDGAGTHGGDGMGGARRKASSSGGHVNYSEMC